MAQHIHCTVENCYYWDSGNVCLAKEILVTIDSMAEQYPERVDANVMMEVATEIGTTPANTCMATCCKTFYSKDKGGSGTVPRISRSEYDRTKKAQM